MRGPKPKPSFLKIVGNTERADRVNPDEPEPSGDLADPPGHLSSRAQSIWRDCIANAPPGLLKKLDGGVLEIYVCAKETFELASAEVSEQGAMVKIGKWTGHNPYLAIRNSAAAVMLKAAADLGFSPSSRSRVKVKGKKKSESAFAKLRQFSV